MAGYLSERDAAVGRGLEEASRLRAYEDRDHIDYEHQDASEHSRFHGLSCYIAVLADTEVSYDVDDDDAERESGDGVHCAVALDESVEECSALIVFCRCHLRYRRSRVDESNDHEYSEEHEEERIYHASDPYGDLARSEREVHYEREEYECECELPQSVVRLTDNRLKACGK